MVFLNASIFADILHFLNLFLGDSEHVLEVVDVDVDEAVDEEDCWAFVVIGDEGIGGHHYEQGYYEYYGEYHEDVASP